MSNPNLIPEPFAKNGEKNTIPLERDISDPVYRATWLDGFPPDTRIPEEIGGEAPDGLDFNGLFNALSQAVVFLQKGNAYQFDVSLTPYPIGALVRSDDNLTTYQSIVASNSSNPNTDLTGWRVYNSSSFIVDNLTTNDSKKSLSAAQGKKLQDEKLAVADLVNDLTSGGIKKALTAEQGKVLFNMFDNILEPTGRKYFPNPSDQSKPFILQWGRVNTDAYGFAYLVNPIVFPNAVLGGFANEAFAKSWNDSTTKFATIWGMDFLQTTKSLSVACCSRISDGGAVVPSNESTGTICVWGY